MTQRHVLLTGATGFIGRHAIRPLLDAGCTVHSITSHEPQATSHEPQATWHHANLLDPNQTSRLIDDFRPTHLLHFAWIATPGIYQTSPENEDWKRASLHLFAECRRYGCRRIVGAGSCFEYLSSEAQGDDDAQGHYVEDAVPPHPNTVYGQRKKECGEALLRMEDVSAAWGRIFFLYGPQEHPDRLVSSVIRSLLHGKQAACTHGRQIRDFLHVQDVADAFVALLLSDIIGPVNIASGTPITVATLVRTIGTLMGKEPLIALGARPAPSGEPPRITADVTRLQEEVGWKPAFTVESGLQETIEWWRKKGM